MSRPTEEQLSEAIDDKEHFSALLASPGWEKLKKIIEEEIEQLRAETERPLDAMDQLASREHKRGGIYYAKFFLGLPETVVGNAEACIEAYKESTDGEEAEAAE